MPAETPTPAKKVAYYCMACPETFVDAASANAHCDATGHHQTWRQWAGFAARQIPAADRDVFLRVTFAFSGVSAIGPIARLFGGTACDITGYGSCWRFETPAAAQTFIDAIHALFRAADAQKPEFGQVTP